METNTARKIHEFLVKSQEPNNGSTKSLTSKANLKKEMAEFDKKAKALANQILDMFEDG